MSAPLIDQCIEQIRDLIVGGVLIPGARLPPEHVLAELLGCSRNTTREAVRSLVMARVLDVRRGDGTYVTSLEPRLLLEGVAFAVDLITDENLLELWELRRLLEPPTAAKAARRITEDEVMRLEVSLDAMQAADEVDDLVRHDVEFHDVVAQVAGNQSVATLLASIASRILRARIWHGVADAAQNAATVLQHADILAALRAHDADRAHAAALLHVASNEAWLRRIVSAASAAAGQDEDAATGTLDSHRVPSPGSVLTVSRSSTK